MERLTHEADFGLEDWEETLFFVKSDPNGAYNIIDIAKYQGEPEFDEILKNVALRLAAYENTGLEPEEIVKIREDIENGYMKSTARRYGVPVDRLRELAEADRLIGMTVYESNKRGFISTYEVISVHISKCSILVGWNLLDGVYSNLNGFEISALGKSIFLTREEAEAALVKLNSGT